MTSIPLPRPVRAFARSTVMGVRKTVREGGPYQQWRTAQGRRAMTVAAATLEPLEHGVEGPAVEVCLVSGARYWYQSLFCMYSIQRQLRSRLAFHLFDDGTLSEAHRDAVRRVVPWVRFSGWRDVEQRLDRVLPRERFPVLRSHRIVYPQLRKLLDVHAGVAGWRLVLDSDMLVFRRPDFLLEWLDAPRRPCHMQDCTQSYGYSTRLMEQLAGTPIPPRVNVGVCGLRSDTLDWERLEWWCDHLMRTEGVSYFLEQALTAMVLGSSPCAVAPALDYVVLPGLDEGAHPTAVLHHYVAESKRSYFQVAWRHVATPRRAPHD